MNTFQQLNLIEPLLSAIADEGYTEPTPIQLQAIPPLLEGHDVLGCAQTGTGKTAAFLLPILQKIHNNPTSGRAVIRALVLTPTRELAAQIAESFDAYSQFIDLTQVVVFGGVNQKPQVAKLKAGVDVLIATPGRLMDLHNQGYVDFDQVAFFVLDEADRMLDMGFIADIRRILKMLPDKKQNLLFSATMPDSIVKLASSFLHEPVRVEVDPQSTTVELIRQQVMYVLRQDKRSLLKLVLQREDVESAIVFTRTKHGANRVVKALDKAGIRAAAIHGNKSQSARTKALAAFKAGEVMALVATDIASRGIDIDGVSHVINYDLPNISESYVHRIGRTGRAGAEGIAIAFCDETETGYLRDIEKLTGKPLEVVTDHSLHSREAMLASPAAKPKPKKRGAGKGNSDRRRHYRGQSRRR